ncbi:MAG: type II toxin-antitoxin system Phd/YefM family antitoxin [Angustibacter sp.]
MVPVHYAKTHLSSLLARVERGETVIIARGKTPVARLMPLAEAGVRRLGFVAYDVPDSFFEALPEAELHAWAT